MNSKAEFVNKYSFILLLLLAVSTQSSAQSDQKETNHQFWFDFYPHFFVNEKLEYYGDAGIGQL